LAAKREKRAVSPVPPPFPHSLLRSGPRYAADRSPEEKTAMMPSVLRYPAVLAFFVAATSACTSPASPVDTFVSATVAPSGMAAGLCNFGSLTDWLHIGTATGTDPTKVANGDSQGGGKVSATCTVHQNGNAFDLELNAALGGIGSVTILSRSGQGVTTGGGKDLSASFESASMGQFSQDGCTLSYTYNGAPVPRSPTVAPGRIWGHISCPAMQDPDVNKTLPDGGVGPQTCDGEADFLFEYCGQ
jgi:hypothetical protein